MTIARRRTNMQKRAAAAARMKSRELAKCCRLIYIYIYIYVSLSLSPSLYTYIYIYISLSLYIYIYILFNVELKSQESLQTSAFPSLVVQP